MIPRKISEDNEIEYVPMRNDPYAFYRNRYVKIVLPSTREAGVYQGYTTNGQLVLQPHLNFSVTLKGEESKLTWSDEPMLINFSLSTCVIVLPEKKSELDRIVERSANIEYEHPVCLI